MYTATNVADATLYPSDEEPTNLLTAADVDRLLAASPSSRRRHLNPIDWKTLQGTPPARQWWLQDWLSPTPTLVAGAGGMGKSMLLQAVCTSIATGREYLSPVEQARRCMIWSCEDDVDEIWRRQAAINDFLGIVMDDLALLHVVPRIGQDNTLFAASGGLSRGTRLLNELREQVNDLQIDVLVLDNVAQIYGGNSHDAHQVTAFVNAIAGLVANRPFCPVLVGHVAKSFASEFAGSAAWENAVRMRWHLRRGVHGSLTDDAVADDLPCVYLSKGKANYSGKDSIRLSFDRGMLSPATMETAGQLNGGQAIQVEQVVIAGLRKLVELGIHVNDSRTSPAYLPKQLAEMGLVPKAAKTAVKAAMNRLIAAGKLRSEPVGKYANGTVKNGLVEVPD